MMIPAMKAIGANRRQKNQTIPPPSTKWNSAFFCDSVHPHVVTQLIAFSLHPPEAATVKEE